MKKAILLFSLIICTRSFAQHFSAALNFNLGFPLDEFKQVNNRTGAGARFNFMYKPSPATPVYVGLELGYQVRGWSYRNFGDYQLNASSNVFSSFLNVRIQAPGNMAVKPFIDGMIGMNDFFSTVTVDRRVYYDEPPLSYSNSSNARWVLAYGGSAGLDIRLSRQDDLWFEIKTTYLVGGSTTYLSDPKVSEQGDVSFVQNKSATSMLIPQVGVKFNF